MRKGLTAVLLCGLASLAVIPPAAAVERKPIEGLAYTRQSDVIYHRNHGAALTMDVIYPKKTNSYTLITDPKRIHQLLADNSPISHVSAGDAPTLIVHGEKDRLVPLLQASKMVDALKAVGVKSKLVVAKGKGHSWREQWTNEMKHIADWFDAHLAAPKK